MSKLKVISLLFVILSFAFTSFGKSNDKKSEQNEKKFANMNIQQIDKTQNQKDSKKQRIHHTYQVARPAAENKVEETGAK